MGCAAAAFVFLVLRPEPKQPPSRVLATPAEAAPFAHEAGVGDESLSSGEDSRRPVIPLVFSIGVPIPKKPFDGQRKPPCDPSTETAVLGACWSVLKKEAPCGPQAFDYEGLCLRASFDAPRQPTSEQP